MDAFNGLAREDDEVLSDVSGSVADDDLDRHVAMKCTLYVILLTITNATSSRSLRP